MIEDVLERIRAREGVRHPLGDGGVLHMDRGLPFILVYREPPGREDPGTDQLVTGEASFLVGRRGGGEDVPGLTRGLAETGSTVYGAFLVLEIWSGPADAGNRFSLRAPAGPAPETIRKLAEGLETLSSLRSGLEVVVEFGDERHPGDLPPLLTLEQSWQGEVLLLGLEVPPIYRDPATAEVYPRFLRQLRRELSRVIRRAVYEFVRVQTSVDVVNPLALGTRTVPDVVWEIDRALVALEQTFDPLLLTSPVNLEDAWARFREQGFEHEPEFHYRLLPIDPDLLKRRLFALEMESIDDPALADLFQDKRQELDTLLTMLGERGTPAFRHGSHRLYGTVDDRLHQLARELLASIDPPGAWEGEWVDAEAFRQAAADELAHYARLHPALTSEIQIRRDINGLMVSRGNLLIGEKLRIRPDRVQPLLHHEVGTHVLTYANGRAQPLEQLALGLADYDELQEGLAVLSEYLVGGLDGHRMRLLAARVIAARSVEEGADFLETFRCLRREHGYSASGAWHITARVHASGGFTRDLIYLRGLVDLMELLARGGDLQALYIGKIALKHIPAMDELRHRQVLRDPPLTPRFLSEPDAEPRLQAVRAGITLTEMVCPPSQ